MNGLNHTGKSPSNFVWILWLDQSSNHEQQRVALSRHTFVLHFHDALSWCTVVLLCCTFSLHFRGALHGALSLCTFVVHCRCALLYFCTALSWCTHVVHFHGALCSSCSGTAGLFPGICWTCLQASRCFVQNYESKRGNKVQNYESKRGNKACTFVTKPHQERKVHKLFAESLKDCENKQQENSLLLSIGCKYCPAKTKAAKCTSKSFIDIFNAKLLV